MNNLLEKLSNLKKRFSSAKGDPQDVNTIVGWEQEAKRLLLLKSLKGHDGVKYILEIFKGEVEKIDEVLRKTYSKDLSDRERDRLLDKKDLAQRYLNLFDGVEEQLEKLEETVDKEDGVNI